MKNQALAQAIVNAKDKRREWAEEISRLKAQCRCSIAKKDKPDGRYGIYPDWGSAFCETCGEDYNWYCPDSPDHTCHYFSTPGEGQFSGTRYVTLIDGTAHTLPQEHDPMYETDDQCIFCGDPEERK